MAKHSLGGRTPLRGQKKEKATFSITPDGLDILDAIAKRLSLPSRSEAIEYIVRKEFKELEASEKNNPTHSTNAA